jgi:hypothetical protein
MIVVLLMLIRWTGGRGGATTKPGGRTQGRGLSKSGTTGAGRKKAPIGGGGGGSTTNSGGGGGQKNSGTGGGGTKTGSSNTICGWVR